MLKIVRHILQIRFYGDFFIHTNFIWFIDYLCTKFILAGSIIASLSLKNINMKELEEILKSEITSINIGTVLTMIKPIDKKKGTVTEHPMGDYEKIISGLKTFKIRGMSKPAKVKKYVSLAEKKGFKIDKKSIKPAGLSGQNSDVLNYFILFKK